MAGLQAALEADSMGAGLAVAMCAATCSVCWSSLGLQAHISWEQGQRLAETDQEGLGLPFRLWWGVSVCV